MTERPCFEVEFSDGTVIVADAEHQWLTSGAIRTTQEIAETLPTAHTVTNTAAIHRADADLPVPPYTFGATLGGSTADPEIQMWIGGEAPSALGAAVQDRIPAEYLRASETQRRALLAGLLDTC